MQQKGGIALILLILVVIVGLVVGVYFISQKTGFFSFAGSAQITIPYASTKATPVTTATPSAVYENPFDQASSYDNPFENSYENPFNSL